MIRVYKPELGKLKWVTEDDYWENENSFRIRQIGKKSRVSKIEVGGCACTEEQDIFETLPLKVYGGWDGNFDPSIKMGELKKEKDVVINTCPNCLGSVVWKVIDDSGFAYFERPY